jgi:hypothetical protein
MEPALGLQEKKLIYLGRTRIRPDEATHLRALHHAR